MSNKFDNDRILGQMTITGSKVVYESLALRFLYVLIIEATEA